MVDSDAPGAKDEEDEQVPPSQMTAPESASKGPPNQPPPINPRLPQEAAAGDADDGDQSGVASSVHGFEMYSTTTDSSETKQSASSSASAPTAASNDTQVP